MDCTAFACPSILGSSSVFEYSSQSDRIDKVIIHGAARRTNFEINTFLVSASVIAVYKRK